MEIPHSNFTLKNVSYIRARDPSILAWNITGLDNVRVNLQNELNRTHNLEEEIDKIQVFLRIKNAVLDENLYKTDEKNLICKIPSDSNLARNAKDNAITKKYSFSRIFGPTSTQLEMFNDIVKGKMLNFINGKNSTLLTYGTSGAGKTFTLVGTSDEPGLLPRALEYLFRTIPQLSTDGSKLVKPLANGDVMDLDEVNVRQEQKLKNQILNHSALNLERTQHIKTYKAMQHNLSCEPAAILDESSDVTISVWVSFAEIYNEHIYDLLQTDTTKSKANLRLGSVNNLNYIKNLTCIHVLDGLEAFQVLQYGLHNLNYASTSINDHSSRSHAIFTIKLVQYSHSDGGIYMSSFNFCDLAGSERSTKTKNIKIRQFESNNINTSLLVLGRCIKMVRDKQKNAENAIIPFRESKLTQLFQRALLGFEEICMVVNINPSREMFDESQHVLNFSAIAKDISLESQKVVLQRKKNSRFSQYLERETVTKMRQEDSVQDLQNMIANLRMELESQRIQAEQDQQMCVDHVVREYDKICKAKQERLDQAQAELKAMHSKYNLLKARFQQESHPVIDLTSTNDEDDELISELNERIKKLERDKKEIKMELQNSKFEKQKQAQKYDQEIVRLQEEIYELHGILEDGKNDYEELENKFSEERKTTNELRVEVYKLKEEISFLQTELDFSKKLIN